MLGCRNLPVTRHYFSFISSSAFCNEPKNKASCPRYVHHIKHTKSRICNMQLYSTSLVGTGHGSGHYLRLCSCKLALYVEGSPCSANTWAFPNIGVPHVNFLSQIGQNPGKGTPQKGCFSQRGASGLQELTLCPGSSQPTVPRTRPFTSSRRRGTTTSPGRRLSKDAASSLRLSYERQRANVSDKLESRTAVISSRPSPNPKP